MTGSRLWVRSRRESWANFGCGTGSSSICAFMVRRDVTSERWRSRRSTFGRPACPGPKVRSVPELDEFDAFRMMQLLTPKLVESDPEVRRLSAVFEANRHTPEAGRLLQKLFEAVSRSWCSGVHDTPELESWSQFRARIQAGIDRIRKMSAQSRNVVAISSGGPIAATVAQVLGLPPATAIEFVWLSRNGSFSEFLFSGERFSMHSFNSIPHFDDRRLLTYR